MADLVIAGTDPRRFVDEVFSVHVDDRQFSWSQINGEAGDTILPAIMMTTIQPAKFKETQPGYRFSDTAPGSADDKIILIPSRAVCNSGTEVVALVDRIFADIVAKKTLSDLLFPSRFAPSKSMEVIQSYSTETCIMGNRC